MSFACLQIFLAEFLVLSRETSMMILSDWSSASELLVRLSQEKIPHISGCSAEPPLSFISLLSLVGH